jgi:hypothetical protein
MPEFNKSDFEEQEITNTGIEVPKKYLCECIDCIGEWTGIYKNKAELVEDIILYCRTGKAKCIMVD